MPNISLKELSHLYLEWARNLHNDPEVLSVLSDPHVVSKGEQERWFEKLAESTTSLRYIISVDGEPFGVVRQDHIDMYNRSVCVGLDIHRDFRGCGLATVAYEKIFEEWFVRRKFNRLWLLVAEFNVRAHNLYKKLGFMLEGEQRKAIYRNGKYYDYYMMSILKEEYVNTSL